MNRGCIHCFHLAEVVCEMWINRIKYECIAPENVEYYFDYLIGQQIRGKQRPEKLNKELECIWYKDKK